MSRADRRARPGGWKAKVAQLEAQIQGTDQVLKQNRKERLPVSQVTLPEHAPPDAPPGELHIYCCLEKFI